MKNLFKAANEKEYENMVVKEKRTIEGDHDRVEERIYTILPLMYLFGFKKIWNGLQTYVKVENRIYCNGKETTETRYFISSLPLKKSHKIAQAIRQHWHVENRLHWRLDVVFREDESRVRRGYASENFSLLRKIVLNQLDKSKAFNAGKEIQRLYAGWSQTYLKQLIGF